MHKTTTYPQTIVPAGSNRGNIMLKTCFKKVTNFSFIHMQVICTKTTCSKSRKTSSGCLCRGFRRRVWPACGVGTAGVSTNSYTAERERERALICIIHERSQMRFTTLTLLCIFMLNTYYMYIWWGNDFLGICSDKQTQPNEHSSYITSGSRESSVTTGHAMS